METLDYNFPKVRGVDMAFPTYEAPEVLLKQAKEKGFYNGNTPANDLFSEWFFNGLKELPDFKQDIDKERAQNALTWVRAFMGSFAPKHEEKEAICALIFNEIFELPV